MSKTTAGVASCEAESDVSSVVISAANVSFSTRTTASVELRLFDKAQHAMAVVEAPDTYKAHHVKSLLARVPDFLS